LRTRQARDFGDRKGEQPRERGGPSRETGGPQDRLKIAYGRGGRPDNDPPPHINRSFQRNRHRAGGETGPMCEPHLRTIGPAQRPCDRRAGGGASSRTTAVRGEVPGSAAARRGRRGRPARPSESDGAGHAAPSRAPSDPPARRNVGPDHGQVGPPAERGERGQAGGLVIPNVPPAARTPLAAWSRRGPLEVGHAERRWSRRVLIGLV